ncbi:MAG: hypothetical protein ACR2NZ_15280 [Rubripirellula sp.]
MKYSMAEVWGIITLLSGVFAAIKFLHATPDAMLGVLIIFIPVHAIIFETVQRMSRVRRNKNRIL